MATKNLPTRCPSCSNSLAVRQMACSACSTQLEGLFDLPLLAQLSREDQEFIVQFVLTGGSLKDMAKLWAVSYPTARNRLDDLITKVNLAVNGEKK